jgi:enamine deaminase RidA (YjgF/YER057c/UK114 family)
MNNVIERESIQPDAFPEPLGLYSHAISIRADKLLFVSGQVSVDEKNRIVGQGDLAVQTEQVFKNLDHVLESAGTSFDGVVEFTVYIVKGQDLEHYYNKRSEIFSRIFPKGDYPAITLLVIERLAHEEVLIEIKAVAALP